MRVAVEKGEITNILKNEEETKDKREKREEREGQTDDTKWRKKHQRVREDGGNTDKMDSRLKIEIKRAGR